MSMTWEEVEEVIRPDPAILHMGRMKVDPEKCTSCGLCIENCLFRTWEMDENNIPRFKEGWPCFSCYNCMVACPAGAISIVEPYHVDGGFWETKPHHRLPALMPLEPRNAEGKTDKWNTVERVVFTRRTVRNFSDKPVPEPLVRRVLEAGRHGGTAGNAQPCKFTVITNKTLIDEMNKAGYDVLNGIFEAYMDDEAWKDMARAVQDNPSTVGLYDPRLIFGGIGKSIVANRHPMLMGAPVAIVISADSRAIGGPDLQTGIAGQSMTLVANSLGLKASWVGFTVVLNSPEWLDRLGIEDPFKIVTAVALGYPKFKQEGAVPREFRPITWFREGRDGSEIEELPDIPEIKEY